MVVVALLLARAGMLVWWVPVFGGPHTPAPMRVGMGMMLAALVAPAALQQAAGVAGWSSAMVVAVAVRELAVGAALGFLVAAVFRAAEMAGRLVDTLRGANMAEVLSPVTGERSSPLGQLHQLLAALVFVELGGLGHVARAFAHSYEALPLAPVPLAAGARAFASVAIAAAARILECAVGLAAPVLVAMILVDVALGVLGRVAPQIPVHFVGMPLKALAGVAVVLLGLGGLHVILAGEMRGWAALVERGVSAWSRF